ncbi:THAP domain-containing protein 1-like [Dermacentor silvarum]|uniref:THAP domain-containing protein 1-like n=1 Tax=Dermacentor silvarum TaxID=543639 RepID=UPI0021013A62|nr:THAP domain-containing protein 1-like [Dermacentor silvarum]
MPSCSAFGCRTRETDGKRLFRIPSAKRDAAQRKVWLQRISRADFNPTQWSRLCEDHFTDDQFELVILQSCGTKKIEASSHSIALRSSEAAEAEEAACQTFWCDILQHTFFTITREKWCCW